MRQFLIAALIAACAAACGTPSQVTLDTGGLKYESGGIGIAFKDPAKRQFIDGNWLIDNWNYITEVKDYSTSEGVPNRVVYAAPHYERKAGKPYEGTLRVDMNNDGAVEDYNTFFTDLELRNAATSGQIWVLMRELPKHRAEVKLDVFVEEYAERLSFEEYTRVGPFDVWLLPTKKYAARVISKEFVKLGTLDAVVATIEIANLAQLQLDPQSRMGFVRVLMVRVPGFVSNVVPGDVVLDGSQSSPYTYTSLPRSNTGLLVVGYYDSTAYFEKGLADFEAFLGQFTVNGKPVKVERTAPPAPPEPPKPAPPVAPESTKSIESTPSTDPPPAGSVLPKSSGDTAVEGIR